MVIFFLGKRVKIQQGLDLTEILSTEPNPYTVSPELPFCCPSPLIGLETNWTRRLE